MTKEEILDYNKLCAEFLKKDIGHDNMVIWDKNWTSMKFHSDWNWIMEVVEAIEELEFNNENCTNQRPRFTIAKYSCFLHIYNDSKKEIKFSEDMEYYYHYWWPNNNREYEMKNSKKEAVVEAIYKFLTWYSNVK